MECQKHKNPNPSAIPSAKQKIPNAVAQVTKNQEFKGFTCFQRWRV
jgi:hypothetical protein